MGRKRKGIVTAVIAGMVLMMAAPAMAEDHAKEEQPDAGTQVVNAIGGVIHFTFKLTGQVLSGVGTLLGNIGKTFTDTADEGESK